MLTTADNEQLSLFMSGQYRTPFSKVTTSEAGLTHTSWLICFQTNSFEIGLLIGSFSLFIKAEFTEE